MKIPSPAITPLFRRTYCILTGIVATKQGAIVGGQTSCKDPEIKAFEAHLPQDVEIVSIHSLHGPKVDTKSQPLVFIKHRASDEALRKVEAMFACFNSKHVYLTAHDHDRITADTQAVTHAAFLSMGTAWYSNKQFPWELSRYVGGIENVKINITLRIYSNKWHVYAGLAILNPSAKEQIRQYAKSVTELFKLMLEGNHDELSHRIKSAGSAVFKDGSARNLLLRDDVLDRFSLGTVPKEKTPNNHLSLLAMVDSWNALGINPYDHIICSTPVSCWSPSGMTQLTCVFSCFVFGLGPPSIFSANQHCWTKSSRLRLRTRHFAQMIWNLPLLLGSVNQVRTRTNAEG